MARASSRSHAENDPETRYTNLAAYWVSRLAVQDRRFQLFLASESPESELGRGLIGIETLGGRIAGSEILAQARKRLRGLAGRRLIAGSPLGRNMSRLRRLAGLTALERDVLAFVVLAYSRSALGNVLMTADNCSSDQACEILATALGYERREVRASLRPRGSLAETQLVSLEPDPQNFLAKFRLMDGLSDVLLSDCAELDDLLGHFFSRAPAARLSASDYPHLAEDLLIATRYLRSALDCSKRGVNLLLYGIPGSGKTEFARLVAALVEATLYQISAGTAEREMPAKERLGFYVLCQRFLRRSKRAIVLFDEAEDVFPSYGEPSVGKLGKARLNELLESNHVPAIWISNDVSRIDEAYLRRFDYSIKFDSLPNGIRRRVLESTLSARPDASPLLSALERLACATPSLALRAVKVADASAASTADRIRVVERVVSQWGALTGTKVSPVTARPALDLDTAISAININHQPQRLMRALSRVEIPVAALFYGPPGTGKTQLARTLARATGRPIVQKRPSDLLGPYVGQSERNVTEAFEQAKEAGALLFLDEIDALLHARATATHGWEVSLVSELLMAMEDFGGALIGATNDLRGLDHAVLRRFGIKVAFDYMTEAQRAATLARLMEKRDATTSLEAALRALRQLPATAIGDFAAVERRLTATGERITALEYVGMLAEECSLRNGARALPGFIRAF